MTYDAEGRLTSVVQASTGTTISYVYDHSGQRVARLVNGATPQFSFGRLFDLDIANNVVTRHVYVGSQRIAQSMVLLQAGSPLLARATSESSFLAIASTAFTDAAGGGPRYPHVLLAGDDAAKLLALVVLLLVLAELTPGRVRLALGWRRVRRGHVVVLVVGFGLSVTPLTCVTPTRAATGDPGDPPPGVYPTYFVYSDHLGSTTMLTCYKRYAVENCPDGTPMRYYRYDAYGTTKMYDQTGAAVAAWNIGTDRLYTGQRWDWQTRLYDYGARHYDPRPAAFLTTDPVREYMNPYAYVAWNPVMFTDPTGMYLQGSFDLYLTTLGPEAAARYASWSGGGAMAGGTGVGSVGGLNATGNINGSVAGMLTAGLAAQFAADVRGIAEAQGGGVSTAAYPVLNASLVNQSASTSPPGSTGTALAPTLSALPASGGGSTNGGAPTPFSSSSGGTADGRGAGGGSPGAASGGFPGYVDINVTGGNLLGVTGGVILTSTGYYVYAGGGLTTPGASVAVTYSPFDPSSGGNVAAQATFVGSGQGGYSFESGFYYEGGVGYSAGASITAFYAFGPFEY